MVGDVFDDSQLHVRQRAHRQRDLFAHQSFDQARVFLAADAMIDAAYFEHIQGFVDIRGRPFFARMCNGQPAFAPCPREHLGKFRGRVTEFGRI